MAQPRTSTSPSIPELSKLVFEKKNGEMLHIPSGHSSNSKNKKFRIEKRPLLRPSVASPYAGASVPKTVYVGSKTPFISAIKRVRKLLALAEQRAMMPILGKKRSGGLSLSSLSSLSSRSDLAGGRRGGEIEKVLEKCRQRLQDDKVIVKATGRAIEKALNVARSFEQGGKAQLESGLQFDVVVKTGSVCVVDDIVEDDDDTVEDENEAANDNQPDTSDHDISMVDSTDSKVDVDTTDKEKESQDQKESKNQRRRRRKRERVREQRLKAFCDEDGETPESRTRWVNMVEITINMK